MLPSHLQSITILGQYQFLVVNRSTRAKVLPRVARLSAYVTAEWLEIEPVTCKLKIASIVAWLLHHAKQAEEAFSEIGNLGNWYCKSKSCHVNVHLCCL